jgi:putative addiction module component
MSSLLEQIVEQSRLLTTQEKATLARILIEGLDASSNNSVEQLWVTESKRRYQAYLRGEIEAIPGEEVMAQARNKLK